MKSGLRKQFDQTLALPNVHYFGHVQIGAAYDLSLAELESFRPAAIVFASGAQGAKSLGLPGEECAKASTPPRTLYTTITSSNRTLPAISRPTAASPSSASAMSPSTSPAGCFSTSPPSYTESVVIVARRGPFEVKFDKKEIEHVEPTSRARTLVAELTRVKARCAQAKQDASPEKESLPNISRISRIRIRAYSAAPRRFASFPRQNPSSPMPRAACTQMVVTENDLVAQEATAPLRLASTDATATPRRRHRPLRHRRQARSRRSACPWGQKATPPSPNAAEPKSANPKEPSFEVWDPAGVRSRPGKFVVGWARKASTGLAGLARHDGELGARRRSSISRRAAIPEP